MAGLALAAALAAASPAKLALSGGGTLELSGVKSATWQLPRHHLEYNGSPVHVTLRDMVLTCNRLGVQLDEADQQVVSSTCDGDVRLQRGARTLTCDKATFDDPSSRFTCEGKPVIRNGATSMACSKVVYDLTKDEVTMDDCRGTMPGDQVDSRIRTYQERRKPKPAGGTK
jgi:lipopolysaccharide export system protein LptA